VKTIDLENHFITPAWTEALRNNVGAYPTVDDQKGLGFAADAWMPLAVEPKLVDLADYRLSLMDAAGVDYAVLSVTSPGAEQFAIEVGKNVARDANDLLFEVTKKYPDRFGGFASLAPKDPEWSAQELERCVKELGFKGLNTHSNYGDSYLDDKRYWPLLAKAEELDVPIYLHPAVPMIAELREFGMVLGGPTLGFGTDVTYCFMRMIVRGVFDAYPNLKIIMGHLGEALPFLVDRVNRAWMQNHQKPNPEIGEGSKEPAGYYLKKNLWVTTSGNYLPAAFVCTRDAIGMDKILLGTDFPYENMKDCMDYLRSLPLTEDEAYALFEGNAKGLLRI
jgi:predicted TIM-barrel fold metal-dependent hydrolase